MDYTAFILKKLLLTTKHFYKKRYNICTTKVFVILFKPLVHYLKDLIAVYLYVNKGFPVI